MDNQHSEKPVTAQEILDRKARFEAGMPKSQNYSKMILSTAAKQLGMINLKFMNADFQHVIQAKCAIEQVLREWPPATECQLKQNTTEIDRLAALNAGLTQQLQTESIRNSQLEQQRDELLAALVRLTAFCSRMRMPGCPPSDSEKLADEAIAKAGVK